jgi:exopolysaccharide production protein ExoZ
LEKIKNIQALRAFAAAFVVFYHCDYAFFGLRPFGAFGVDVFFVISGFIMAYLCAAKPDRFFQRRLLRILPLYWTATVAVFATCLAFPAMMQTTRPDLAQLAKSLLFIPFLKSPGHIQPTLFLGWTLNYEMFCYATVALGLWLSRSRAIIVSSALVVGTMLACLPFAGRSVVAEFYGNPIVLEFIAGTALYRMWQRIAVPPRAVLWATAGASTAALIALDAAAGPTLRRAGLMPTSFALVFAVVMLSRSGADTRSRLAVLCGDASYVLYLLHPYAVRPATRLLARYGVYNLATVMLVLAATVAIAIAVHLYCERPVTRWLSRSCFNRVGNATLARPTLENALARPTPQPQG